MGLFDFLKRKLGYNIKNNNGVNEEYYNKRLIRKYFKKNGKLHGKYYQYNCSEIDAWIEIEVNFKEGKRHGLTKYFWKKHLSAEGNFTNGQETGLIKKYFAHDKDVKRHPLVEESADLDKGIYETYSLNGKLLERSQINSINFVGGELSSLYGFEGRINPVRSGLCEKWFENGNLKEKGSVYNSLNKSYRKGEYIQFYENGNLKEKGYWEWKGFDYPQFRKGEHIKFYENGNISKIGEWIKEFPVGLHNFYYPNGNLKFEIKFGVDNFYRQYYDFYPFKEIINETRIIEEKWYCENGSLMSLDDILQEKGNYPIHVLGDVKDVIRSSELNQESFVLINDLKFKRKGPVNYYIHNDTIKFINGHSYELLE